MPFFHQALTGRKNRCSYKIFLQDYSMYERNYPTFLTSIVFPSSFASIFQVSDFCCHSHHDSSVFLKCSTPAGVLYSNKQSRVTVSCSLCKAYQKIYPGIFSTRSSHDWLWSNLSSVIIPGWFTAVFPGVPTFIFAFVYYTFQCITLSTCLY